jgi:hypothetical protein
MSHSEYKAFLVAVLDPKGLEINRGIFYQTKNFFLTG